MKKDEIKIRLDKFQKKRDAVTELYEKDISQIMTRTEDRIRVMQTEFSERICSIYAELDSLRAEAERVGEDSEKSKSHEERARAILEEAQKKAEAILCREY